jgi:hypothetical protein
MFSREDAAEQVSKHRTAIATPIPPLHQKEQAKSTRVGVVLRWDPLLCNHRTEIELVALELWGFVQQLENHG